MAKKKKKKPPQKTRRASRGVRLQRIVFIMFAIIIIASFIVSLIA